MDSNVLAFPIIFNMTVFFLTMDPSGTGVPALRSKLFNSVSASSMPAIIPLSFVMISASTIVPRGMVRRVVISPCPISSSTNLRIFSSNIFSGRNVAIPPLVISIYSEALSALFYPLERPPQILWLETCIWLFPQAANSPATNRL